MVSIMMGLADETKSYHNVDFVPEQELKFTPLGIHHKMAWLHP